MFEVITKSGNVYYVAISKYALEDYSPAYCAAMQLNIEISSILSCSRLYASVRF